MFTFVPEYCFEKFSDATSEFLLSIGVRGIVLDIDNTLIGHNVPMPDKKILSHLRTLENAGIKLCVVSNNRYERVKNFCDKISIKFFVHDALKPKAKGYDLASKEMGLDKKEIAAIGDQIFTDIWGAKRAGCFAILTKPLHKGGEGFFIAFKRFLEKPFLFNRRKTL